MLFGPAGIDVLLPPLGGLPVRRDRILFQQRLLLFREMLPGCRNQGGVHDLTGTGLQTMGTNLSVQLVE